MYVLSKAIIVHLSWAMITNDLLQKLIRIFSNVNHIHQCAAWWACARIEAHFDLRRGGIKDLPENLTNRKSKLVTLQICMQSDLCCMI